MAGTDTEPMIVILPEKRDYKDRIIHPRDPDPLCKVTPKLRNKFRDQVSAVSKAFHDTFAASPNIPAVAKVKLKDQAIAKSYKPTNLFDQKTCPILGENTAGELYVAVTPPGLSKLQQRITSNTSK